MVHNVPCQAENKWLNGKEDEISPRLWRSAWADSLKHPRKGSHYWRYLILSLLLIFFPKYLAWKHLFVFVFWHQTFVQNCLSFHLFLAICLTVVISGEKKNIKCKFLLKLFIRLRYEDKFKTYFWKFGARFETWSSGSILLFF